MGLRYALVTLYERYEVPLFIVENGFGAIDILKEDHTCDDDYRIAYLKEHITEMKKAVEIDGVDLMGYTPWGCIDLVSFTTGESGGHFCDPLIAFMMVYNAVKGNYTDFAGKFEDVPFPYLYVSSAEDYAAYEKYFVDQLPYTDDELVAMSKESMKELKATAASVSIADAESRSAK